MTVGVSTRVLYQWQTVLTEGIQGTIWTEISINTHVRLDMAVAALFPDAAASGIQLPMAAGVQHKTLALLRAHH